MREHAGGEQRRLAGRDDGDAHTFAGGVHARVTEAAGYDRVETAAFRFDGPLDVPLGQAQLVHAGFDGGWAGRLAGEVRQVVEFRAGEGVLLQVGEPFVVAEECDSHGVSSLIRLQASALRAVRSWCSTWLRLRTSRVSRNP